MIRRTNGIGAALPTTEAAVLASLDLTAAQCRRAAVHIADRVVAETPLDGDGRTPLLELLDMCGLLPTDTEGTR